MVERHQAVLVIHLLLVVGVYSRQKFDSWYSYEQVEDGLKLCAWGHCRYYSARYLHHHYAGLFQASSRPSGTCGAKPVKPKLHIKHTAEHFVSVRRERLCEDFEISDGDMCCETITCFHCMTWGIAKDGKRYYVIHLPRNYQYCSVGECGQNNGCETCVQQETLCSLLVFDPPPHWCPWCSYLSFKSFSFPSHCACHNTS